MYIEFGLGVLKTSGSLKHTLGNFLVWCFNPTSPICRLDWWLVSSVSEPWESLWPRPSPSITLPSWFQGVPVRRPVRFRPDVSRQSEPRFRLLRTPCECSSDQYRDIIKWVTDFVLSEVFSRVLFVLSTGPSGSTRVLKRVVGRSVWNSRVVDLGSVKRRYKGV